MNKFAMEQLLVPKLLFEVTLKDGQIVKPERTGYTTSLFSQCMLENTTGVITSLCKEPLPTQVLFVEDLFVPEGYKDVNLAYVSDIAVVVLNEFIVYKRYKTLVTGDKFERLPGEAVCEGDSGGGFAIPKTIDGQNVFYL